METIVSILWVFFGVVSVVTSGLFVARSFADRWRKLPNFLYNSVGGRFALCSSGDFYVAKKKGQFTKTPGGRNLVVVDETACCPLDDQRFPPINHFYPRSENAELFVPYASPSVVAPEGISFLGSQAITDEWIRAKEEQNKKLFWRLRFAEHHYRISDWLLAGTLILFVLSVFTAIGQSVLNERDDGERIVSISLTDANGEVYELRSKGRDAHKLLVYEGGHTERMIYRGVVRDMQILSSNMCRVCIALKNGNVLCGFSPEILQKGSVASMRIEEFLHSPGRPRMFGVWVVPEKDAQSLIKAGFAVEE